MFGLQKRKRHRSGENGMEEFVKLQDITKIYKMGEVEIRAADRISFSIQKGEFVVIGPQYFGRNGYGDKRKTDCGRRRYHVI